jgi:hypothetical protein
MTPQEAIEQIGRSTHGAGMNPSWQTLDGSQVLVARTSEFRWRWFATRLHTFIVAAAFPAGSATSDRLDAFLRASTDYAKVNKGGLPRGLQTGVGVIVVALAESADQAAYGWASAPHGRRFAALPFPVLADASTGQVAMPRRMILGGIYKAYFQSLVHQHIAGSLQWRVVM